MAEFRGDKGGNNQDWTGKPLLLSRIRTRELSTPDLVEVCRLNVHPQWCTFGVTYNFHNNSAKDYGHVDPFASLWVATPTQRVLCEDTVPWPTVPYYSQREWEWDAERNKWSKAPYDGWRATLADLLVGGFIRPSSKMNWLIGEDSFDLAGKYGTALSDKGVIPAWLN